LIRIISIKDSISRIDFRIDKWVAAVRESVISRANFCFERLYFLQAPFDYFVFPIEQIQLFQLAGESLVLKDHGFELEKFLENVLQIIEFRDDVHFEKS